MHRGSLIKLVICKINTLDDTLQMITHSSSNKDGLDSGEGIFQHVLLRLAKNDLHQVTFRCGGIQLESKWGFTHT